MDGPSIIIDPSGEVEISLGGQEPPPERTRSEGFLANLADDMSDVELGSLAAFLIEGIEADEEARSSWLSTANRGADFLGIKLNDPSANAAADGTVCQDMAVCMQKAAVRLWSAAYGELLPAGGPVKGVHNDNPSEDGSNDDADKLTDALERDMNWYLTEGDRGYYPDFSKMLMHRAVIGVAFREVYRCPLERKPISRWIMAQDLIVQGDPAHLNEPGRRVTARKKMPQSVMKRLQASGYYVDVPLVQPTDRPSATDLTIGETTGIAPGSTLPRDYEHTIYECCCELGAGFGPVDLDRDETGRRPGYPLPYRVTLDYDSRIVLAIRRDWKQGDRDHKRRRRYVKYGFIPGMNTGIYDIGLIHMVGNPTQSATMLQRSGVDAALFSNFPGWAMKQGPASRGEQSVFRPQPGEVVKIPVSGNDDIRSVLMPWPYKPMTPETLALIQKLEKDVSDVAGSVELPLGEGRIGNTPVGTIMSYIEAVSMVPGAVHKADHVAQSEEFGLLRDLLADEPELLTHGNKTPARRWQVGRELLSPDIAPRADPNTPSQIHRLLKVQGLITLSGLPQFQQHADARAIYVKSVETLVGEDAAHYTLPPPQPQQSPPDPKLMAAQIKAQTELTKEQNRMAEVQQGHVARMEELRIESADKAADRQAANQREEMKAAAQRTKTGAEMVTEGLNNAHEAMKPQPPDLPPTAPPELAP